MERAKGALSASPGAAAAAHPASLRCGAADQEQAAPLCQLPVSAMSRALGKFSREVAAAFKAIVPKEQKRTQSSQKKFEAND